MDHACLLVSGDLNAAPGEVVDMPAALCEKLLGEAQRNHDAGLKSYGLLVAEPSVAGHPFHPTDVVFLDSRRNRRNDPAHRSAFHAQGEYFRRYDDAGFVADSADLLAAYRRIDDAGQEPIAMFHTHRRQPANFSLIDYRLHNPSYPWHLIISYRTGRPQLKPFRVDKATVDFGISDGDDLQGSERSYCGPEVRSLNLVVYGNREDLRRCAGILGRATAEAAYRRAPVRVNNRTQAGGASRH
jgi:proteasome lid subunit RPN8/RPN11